eukprot:11166885-Lingulodinium_polyedra.AAC.1
MEQDGQWSSDLLRILIVFLAKPAGGERPIALLPMLVRLWDRARRGVLQKWSEEKAQHWDSAVRGSSALRSALLTCMLDESAVKAGQAVCSLYWDIEKFYDSVAYDVVIRRCLERQYHPVLLQLTIRACLGPRLPRQGLHHGSWQWASNSILAGSGQANNLA